MGRITTSKVYYEIHEKLGEGLTSEVYKAFRSDPKGWTRQKVALKMIKSKRNIQILKEEFERLLEIRSKYCVQIIAWESLPKGPALVLEFLNGLTLEKIHACGGLTKELIEEILAQTLLGLKALHRQGFVHGDLNLKNIMVTCDGIVKLIDFGFFHSPGEVWVTPRWASPEVLKGACPKPKDDFYSLSQLEKFLLVSNINDRETTEFLQKKKIRSDHEYRQSKAARRRSLGKMVNRIMSHKLPGTQVINHPRSLSGYRGLFWFLACLVFLIFVFFPWKSDKVKEFGELRVAGHQWILFSVNGLPPRYAPTPPMILRPGHYKVFWETSEKKKEEEIEILPGKVFLLRPEQKDP